jgi:hypothetical protein
LQHWLKALSKPTQKRKMVKESACIESYFNHCTKHAKQRKFYLKGFEMANRWKKLAGLL